MESGSTGHLKIDESRPVPTVALPVRLQANARGVVYIHYDAEMPDGRRVPFVEEIGNPQDAAVPIYFPRGWAWYRCIKQYHELQASVTQIVKERDDALAKLALAEGSLVSERARVAELRRQKGKASD